MGFAGRALLGIGMACNLMGTLKLVTVWFGPGSFAALSGAVFSIGTVGTMAAATPLVFLVQATNWRIAFRLIAGLNLLVTLMLYLVVRDSPRNGKDRRHEPRDTHRGGIENLIRLLRKADYWIISVGTFVRYGIFAAFQALWAGPYLMEVIQLPPVTAGNILLLMNFGVILGGPTWGIVSDRVIKTRRGVVVVGLMGVSATLTCLVLFFPGAGILLLGLLFFCLGIFTGAGLLMYTHIKELMPLEMAGTAMTGINFFTMVGSAVFLQGLGALMQQLYPENSRGAEAYGSAFLVCAAIQVGVAMLYLFTQEKTTTSD
jgi:sugar phosphate permease